MRRLLNSPPDAPESPLMRLQFIREYNPHNVSITMKTAHIYLLVIGLLMYVSYSAKKDNYQVKRQEARVHRQFCAAYTFHPDCK